MSGNNMIRIKKFLNTYIFYSDIKKIIKGLRVSPNTYQLSKMHFSKRVILTIL